MPNLGKLIFIYWNEEQKEEHNTIRHQLIKERVWDLKTKQGASTKEIAEAIKLLKEEHPELFKEAN